VTIRMLLRSGLELSEPSNNKTGESITTTPQIPRAKPMTLLKRLPLILFIILSARPLFV
jgi:hypothetical protein